MNTNHEDERDEGRELSELNAEQRMQALLCAYALGEASEVERKQVEEALASSAGLRAELERFQATIPVVASVLRERAGQALSQRNTAELEAAAARRTRPAVFQRPLVRLAAGLAVVLGGYAVYRGRATPPASADAEGLEVANFERARSNSSTPSSSKAGAAEVEPQPLAKGKVDLDKNSARKDAELPGLAVRDSAGITGQTLDMLDARAPTGDDLKKLRELGYRDAGVSSVSPPAAPEVSVGSTLARRRVESKHAEVPTAPSSATRGVPALPTGAPSGPGSPGPGAKAQLGKAATDGAAPTEYVRLQLEGSKDTGGAAIDLGAFGYLGDSTWEGATKGGSELHEKALAEDSRLAGDDRFAGRTDDFFLGRGERGRFEKSQATQEQERLRRRYAQIHDHCVLPIGPIRPRDMFFRYWGDNPFELTLLDRLSTFSIDVDTASYALARRYLVEGQLPTKEQIRTEEFVNYFKGDVPPPTEGTFAVATELAPSLFGDDSNTWMLRVAVRGKEIAKSERQPLALTFVVDVSGSMREGARLELVKHSLRLLVSQMDANDSISLIKFSNDAALLLPMTSARHKDLIESAIHPLQPDGSTNTEAGLRMGYEQALAALTPNAQNRVVLLTDGVANVGVTDPNSLVQMVERQRKAGIYLNTVGVGMNNVNDNLLEQLANKGDGVCNYVDDEQEVRRALVDNFTGAFQVIARDVKIQVEFDPAQVERYRLLGYENRAIADVDFRNDKVDAGEVGAGHQVVALYELVRRSATGDGPLATVRLRWKPPFQVGVPESEQAPAQEIAHPVLARSAAASYATTSSGYRRSVLVAQFAEFLRRSVHARRDSLERLIDEARRLAGELRDKEFDEFVDMLARSRELIQVELRRRDWLDDCGYLLRHRRYLLGQFEELRRRFPERLGDPSHVERLEQQMRDIEARLGELGARVEGERSQADAELVTRLEAENVELQRRLLELLPTLGGSLEAPEREPVRRR